MKNAWLTLYSLGWKVHLAKNALIDLGQAAKDDLFDELVLAWTTAVDTGSEWIDSY